MDFNKLDKHELALHGIEFATDEETEKFASILREELEARVGEAISKYLSESELEDFNKCEDGEESVKWLELHCPSFREITHKKAQEMEKEIIRYKDRITDIIINKS